SVIWLATQRVNLMLEAAWSRVESPRGDGEVSRDSQLLVSPGVRWSYDFPSGLQIVPGLAFPMAVGPERGSGWLFLYLSFEHPFRAVISSDRR
ncbi:MAG TPA: hypothetical protein VHM30_05930, partial [Gemmatimonadaceae bacterium]|nr:hypothetical protein [Gemmatimonadaceae bacterium]